MILTPSLACVESEGEGGEEGENAKKNVGFFLLRVFLRWKNEKKQRVEGAGSEGEKTKNKKSRSGFKPRSGASSRRFRMAPASSGGTPSDESSSSDSIGGDDRGERERRGRKGTDAIGLRHLLPLASTSSPGDDAAAASALSAALLPLLPPASAAWAYGSGVFSQGSPVASLPPPKPGPPLRPSVDLLLAVADPERWHAANLRRNPGHYSSLARCGLAGAGPAGISWLADNVGPGVWFNSGVRVGGGGGVGGEGSEGEESGASSPSSPTTLKYGVFSERALLADLEAWGELYLAGRLQKPTLRLPLPAADADAATGSGGADFASRLEAALERNAAAALAAALLLLPATFSHARLLSTLVSLSYSGDVRVAAAAEDPRKVERIVRGTGRARLDRLYSRHLPLAPCASSPSPSPSPSPSSCSSSSASAVASAAGLVPLCGGNSWAQDPRWGSRRELVALLPERVRRRVGAAGGGSPSGPVPPSSSPPPPPSLLASSVRAALASTVRSSSARAALVGIISAGPAGAVSRILFSPPVL